MIRNKHITFYPITKESGNFIDPPSPASRFNIPKWFKDLPKYDYGASNFFYNGNTNLTVKSCLPVVDGFTSGYTINLHHDIQVSRENGQTIFRWPFKQKGVPDLVMSRNSEKESSQCGWVNLDGYDDLEFNWFPSWSIRTPKGYSSVFMHPINRIDLPFYTLGGIIDTDGWGEAGSHPFLLKSGWEGIIPKNTPIIQFIPFKRESWQSDIDISMVDEYQRQINKRDSMFKDYYKKFVWSSKNYK